MLSPTCLAHICGRGLLYGRWLWLVNGGLQRGEADGMSICLAAEDCFPSTPPLRGNILA
ncbi:MAG: hypothetical protein KDE51_15345 [Anaerolineales bacterium]|nr:hypothetical protein [Anaerolineales bacterium]